MANEAKRRGPTARRVQDNVRALRRGRGLDLADLSARLTDLGQPMSLSALSKIELGQRRVDADDLVALSLALDVTPDRLLLTGSASPSAEFDVTPNRRMTEEAVWAWASAETVPADPESGVYDVGRVTRWTRENRPHRPPDDLKVSELKKYRAVLEAAAQAVHAAVAETGWTEARTIAAVRSLWSLSTAIGKAANLARQAPEEITDGDR